MKDSVGFEIAVWESFRIAARASPCSGFRETGGTSVARGANGVAKTPAGSEERVYQRTAPLYNHAVLRSFASQHRSPGT
jgi:hypothetical protein